MAEHFEQAMDRLETIVEAIEHDDTTLEQAMSLYKEGVRLAALCGEILERYEGAVTSLNKDKDGIFTQKSFAEEAFDYDADIR